MKVNFFATLRDIAGGKVVEFDVDHGVTAQELLDAVIERSWGSWQSSGSRRGSTASAS